jgi:hypothetical protein
MLYSKYYNLKEPIKCQIISIKNTYQTTIPLKINKEENIPSEDIISFEQWLKDLIISISDKSLIYKHNSESKFCNWC